MRWSLGSFDICFKNKCVAQPSQPHVQSLTLKGRLSETFFSYGNTLPTHRIAHSKYGGLFQPTMTQVIRLLSDPHANPSPSGQTSTYSSPDSPTLPTSLPPSDPFSSSQLTYTTTGLDTFPAPSAYPSRRFSWVHIFPEGTSTCRPTPLLHSASRKQDS